MRWAATGGADAQLNSQASGNKVYFVLYITFIICGQWTNY